MNINETQIKKLAKAIKASGSLTHSEALELIATGLGFANWQTLRAGLQAPTEAAVEKNGAESFLEKAVANHPGQAPVRTRNVRLAHFDVWLAYELSPGDTKFDPSSLEELQAAMEDSDIGDFAKSSDISVRPDQVRPMLIAMQNDGEFFSLGDEDEAPDETPGAPKSPIIRFKDGLERPNLAQIFKESCLAKAHDAHVAKNQLTLLVSGERREHPAGFNTIPEETLENISSELGFKGGTPLADGTIEFLNGEIPYAAIYVATRKKEGLSFYFRFLVQNPTNTTC